MNYLLPANQQPDPNGTAFMTDNPNWLKQNFGVTQSVTLQRIFDNRDNVFAPTEGRRVGMTTEFAGRFLGGDFDLQQVYL